jgi:hypothetical protein
MPKFKKSSGFRMKGYSYPGTSPLTKKDGLGELVTKGSEIIKKGIQHLSDSELMNIIKRNVGAFQYGKLKEGEKYRSKEALDIMSQSTGVDMHEIAQRADSTRAAINIIGERKNK